MQQAATVPPFPRAALFGAAAVIGFAILSAGASRLLGGPESRPVSSVVAERDLRFLDQPDGGVRVMDAASGSAIDTLAPGTNGFIRASLRSLAKRRQFDGQSSQVFRLTAWADGRLTLDDPATGNPIELEAFGQTNEMAFARLLPPGSATP